MSKNIREHLNPVLNFDIEVLNGKKGAEIAEALCTPEVDNVFERHDFVGTCYGQFLAKLRQLAKTNPTEVIYWDPNLS